MRTIFKFFGKIIDNIELGFYTICLLLSKGFFFYLFLIPNLFLKMLSKQTIKMDKTAFRLQNNPFASFSLVTLFVFTNFFSTYVYINKGDQVLISEPSYKIVSEEVSHQETPKTEKKTISFDNNEYRKFGSKSINAINFSELKSINADVVAWITVDHTNINYPIVQTDNNDYYLKHDINRYYTDNGWTFMDYRNNQLNDQNTIFYGHNLFNRTAFGSIPDMFSENWFNNSNHKILVRIDDTINEYQIFSIYDIGPEVYYLQNNFSSSEKYTNFLNTLKSRSIFNFNIDLSSENQIITLSTCNNDNTGRKVVHAVKIN